MHNFSRNVQEIDLNYEHLQAELTRLDVTLRRAVRRWQLAGQDPLDTFRGLYVSDNEVNSLIVRPVGSNWGEQSILPEDEAEAFSNGEQAAHLQVLDIERRAAEHGTTLRLLHLGQAFGLDDFELGVILICLAPSIDLRYERLYAYLQDDVSRKRPTVNLVLDLLSAPGANRLMQLGYFSQDAPLSRHALVERLGDGAGSRGNWLAHTLHMDETVQRWLLGEYLPSSELQERFSLEDNPPAELDALLVGDALNGLNLDVQPVLAVCGPDLSAHQATARLLAQHLQKPMLYARLSENLPENMRLLTLVRLVLRDARLVGALPLLGGWDACLERGRTAPEILDEVFAFPGPLVISSTQPWQPGGVERLRPLVTLGFGIPPFSQRLALWEYFLSRSFALQPGSVDIATSSEAVVTAMRPYLETLAGQFLLTTSQIRDAVASALDLSHQDLVPLEPEHLSAAARLHSNPQLSSLARKIIPRYTWDDIILPVDQRAILSEMIETVRRRALVLEEWGLGRKLVASRGVTALFAGPPGTGKTMAAEIIAGELGLDLYKIELSAIVSKYIGETEKNLERIFNEAEASNAILFFDEADSLFGKRSEVRDSHDRYANIEISYLLQRMEGYDGVTILATNLRANLDEAFTRRLQFAVDFPFPEEQDRLRIWESLFPPGVPRTADINFRMLARRFKLAGGNIRNILVGAAYLAAADGGRVGMSHLLHSTRRELQKMGRLVGDDDWGEYTREGQ